MQVEKWRSRRECGVCGVRMFRVTCVRYFRTYGVCQGEATIRRGEGERVERKNRGKWPSAKNCVDGRCPAPTWRCTRGAACCGTPEVSRAPDGGRLTTN